jgi:drug/metabolite transporter (DMT)-like permease
MKVSGWLEAFAYVWVIAILNLTFAFGKHWGVHPTAFILLAMLIGGVALVVIAGPGSNPWRIVSTPMTWAYGAATILTELTYYLMILQVPPADTSVFMRLNIATSVLIGWLLLGRTVPRSRLLGIAVICAGILAAFAFIPGAQTPAFVATTVACAIVMALRNVSAEFHPWNRSSKTVIEKMRVTGLVVLTTASTGVVMALVIALLTQHGYFPRNAALPTFADFVHGPTVVLALLVGCVLITVMQYLMFSAVVKITSENFFAVMALTLPATLLLQEAVAGLGLAGIKPGAWYVLPYMLIILLGTLLIVWRGGPAHSATAAVPARKSA